MLDKTVEIPLIKLKVNKGQVEGLPKNPRILKDEDYKILLQSIKDDPEMLALRELIVFPLNGHFIVIGGKRFYIRQNGDPGSKLGENVHAGLEAMFKDKEITSPVTLTLRIGEED